MESKEGRKKKREQRSELVDKSGLIFCYCYQPNFSSMKPNILVKFQVILYLAFSNHQLMKLRGRHCGWGKEEQDSTDMRSVCYEFDLVAIVLPISLGKRNGSENPSQSQEENLLLQPPLVKQC